MRLINELHLDGIPTSSGGALDIRDTCRFHDQRHCHDRDRQKADGRWHGKTDPIFFLHVFEELTPLR